MTTDGSYRQILRSSSIIGGASVINVVLGLLRIKIAALLLGPSGVGLIGLLNSLAGTASSIAGMGFGDVGTRQIAEAAGRNDMAAIAATRRALFWGTMMLAVFGAFVFWAMRDVLALHVLRDASLAGDVGWLALMVAMSVAAASQGALLSGMRQIGNLARMTVYSAAFATVLGVGALWLWGRGGLIAFVIAGPLASFLIGHVFVARLPSINASSTPIRALFEQWRILVTLGAAFMVAGLAGTVGQLLVRTLVQGHLGTDALGYFQAAATISMTYIGFVVASMSTDYFPRLTAAIKDSVLANRMVNEQTEVALLMAGPAFLVMMGLAPWVIELLYASSFLPAADVLRWMVLGDIVKIASWPLGFVILAAGDGRTFMLTETLGVGVFVVLTWIGLPWFGVAATGMAFLGAYVVLLPVVYWLARRRTGFRWTSAMRSLFGALMLATVAVLGATAWSEVAGAFVGVILGAGLAAFSIGRLARKANLTGPLGRMTRFFRRWLTRFGVGCRRD